MGNVNGTEDGSSRRPSEFGLAEDEEEAFSGADAQGTTAALLLMGQSPPQSPRAAQSPLMFTSQNPVLPLQKPDELQIPNPSWMHAAPPYEEEMSFEQKIPTMITWSYGGQEVAVEGSWDDWKTRKPLQRSGKEFTLMNVLPSGVYRYRFIVDGQRRYAPELPWAQDELGNFYNILDLLEFVPDDLESISGFEPPQSPELSYDNVQLSSEDFAKEPPMVPPHLQMTLLNVPSSTMEMQRPLSRPQHVVLNHLYMQKGKPGPSVVALGSTQRFLSKQFKKKAIMLDGLDTVLVLVLEGKKIRTSIKAVPASVAADSTYLNLFNHPWLVMSRQAVPVVGVAGGIPTNP